MDDSVIKGRGLIDKIFSWSLSDVLNKNLYNSQVKEIPKTFLSIEHYMDSFKPALIEEAHADLFSNMTRVSRAPIHEVCYLGHSKFHQEDKEDEDLYAISFYDLPKKEKNVSDESEPAENDESEPAENDESIYEPEMGDLIALTDVRPRCIDDLNRPQCPYIIAYVVSLWDDEPDEIRILSAKPLPHFGLKKKDKKRAEEDYDTGTQLFAVYLTNLTTNIRKWQALNSELEWNNYSIIQQLLGTESSADKTCSVCKCKTSSRETLCDFKLNDSQNA